MPASIVIRTKMAGEEFALACAILRFVPSIPPPTVPLYTTGLIWMPPPGGSYKLSCDTSWKNGAQFSYASVAFRSHFGR
ncbi:hypothetical protein RHSIM_RhsimUnG0034000 [Rhododendron simsii]|uniref:Uncharacterized protein n=1 Tax=Rhododendron simsii TaxID=118357 RepID=A0A834FZP6_RHOSS|nr:hypothetical protein RHSIM_RhsimUnG0034000 [Rhododendron simsii]